MQTKNTAGGTLSANFLATVRAAGRTPDYRVYVDWKLDGFGGDGTYDDITGYIRSVKVDRSITSDLPVTSRLVSGNSVATCSITVGGFKGGLINGTPTPSKNAGLVWSRYADTGFFGVADTQRIGCPVKVFVGFAGEFTQIFFGYIRSIDMADDDTATIEVLDASDRMRGETLLPMVRGGIPDHSGSTTEELQGHYGLNSQWIIDYVARDVGVGASPLKVNTAAKKTVASATMHGSCYPDVGIGKYCYTSPVAAIRPVFTQMGNGLGLGAQPLGNTTFLFIVPQDPDGLGYDPPDGDVTRRANTPLLSSTGGVTLEFRINRQASTANIFLAEILSDTGSHGFGVRVNADGTILLSSIISGVYTTIATTGAIPLGESWVGVNFKLAGTALATKARIGGVTTTYNTTPSMPAPFYLGQCAVQHLSGNGVVQAVMMHLEDVPLWGGETWVPQAVFDRGKSELTFLPFQGESVDAWQMLSDVVQAEFGTIGFDEFGTLQFRNFDRWVTSSVNEVWTTGRALKAAKRTESIDSVRNNIIIEVTNFKAGPYEVLWSTDDVYGFHTGETRIIVARFKKPAIDVGTYWGTIPNGGWDLANPASYPAGTNGYRLSWTPNGTGGKPAWSSVRFTTIVSAREAKVKVVNRSGQPIYLVSTGSQNGYPSTSQGKPMIQIIGRTVVSDRGDAEASTTTSASGSGLVQAQVVNAASEAKYGRQLFRVEASTWMQDVVSAQLVADYLAGSLPEPYQAVSGVQVVGDPRLQLQDRILFQGANEWKIDAFFQVYGIETTIDGNGLSQSLNVRSSGVQGAWILGDVDIGETGAIAPVEFGSAGTFLTGASAASAVVAVPASVAVDDVIVAVLYKENSAAVTPPAGFTQLSAVNSLVGNQTFTQYVFWKRATAADSGTYTFSWTGSVWRSGQAFRYTGCIKTGSPFRDSASAASTVAVTNSPPVQLESCLAGEELILLASNYNTPAFVNHEPVDWTFRSATGGQVLGVATRHQFSVGNTGLVGFADLGNTGSMTAFIGALRPVSGAIVHPSQSVLGSTTVLA